MLKWIALYIYPIDCAMHGAWDLRIGRWWFCSHLPTWIFGKYWPPYFYISPDATPTEAVFILGNTE